MQPSHRPSQPSVRLWLVLLGALVLAGVLLIDREPFGRAWAAPVLRPLNQTVPLPTPTSSGDAVATATPRPDDTGDSGNGSDTGDVASPDNQGVGNGEIQLFPNQPGGAGGSADTGLSAMVTVAVLNMREGPGTGFAVLGSFTTGNRVNVVSRSADGAWWYVCCLPGTNVSGWISSQLVDPDFDRTQADTLIPVFGTTPVVTPQAAGTGTPQPEAGAAGQPAAKPAANPLTLDFVLDPPFVWQGITATLTINVTNPNDVDVQNAELSDELPAVLQLLSVTADTDGEVEQITTPTGNTLLIVRWPTIPANTGVSAALVLAIDPTLTDGAVVDNLVAVRGGNAPYNSTALTIGMPPVLPPTFE